MLFAFIYLSLNSNTTDVTSGAGTTNHSGISEFSPGFYWRSFCSILSCVSVMSCKLMFVLSSFSFGHYIVCLSSIYASAYPFGIFISFSKLYLHGIVIGNVDLCVIENRI